MIILVIIFVICICISSSIISSISGFFYQKSNTDTSNDTSTFDTSNDTSTFDTSNDTTSKTETDTSKSGIFGGKLRGKQITIKTNDKHCRHDLLCNYTNNPDVYNVNYVGSYGYTLQNKKGEYCALDTKSKVICHENKKKTDSNFRIYNQGGKGVLYNVYNKKYCAVGDDNLVYCNKNSSNKGNFTFSAYPTIAPVTTTSFVPANSDIFFTGYIHNDKGYISGHNSDVIRSWSGDSYLKKWDFYKSGHICLHGRTDKCITKTGSNTTLKPKSDDPNQRFKIKKGLIAFGFTKVLDISEKKIKVLDFSDAKTYDFSVRSSFHSTAYIPPSNTYNFGII